MISLLVTVIHCDGSSGDGIISSEMPSVDGCRICQTIEKHWWFSSACFNPNIRFFLSLFFVAVAAVKSELRNSLHFVCASRRISQSF